MKKIYKYELFAVVKNIFFGKFIKLMCYDLVFFFDSSGVTNNLYFVMKKFFIDLMRENCFVFRGYVDRSIFKYYKLFIFELYSFFIGIGLNMDFILKNPIIFNSFFSIFFYKNYTGLVSKRFRNVEIDWAPVNFKLTVLYVKCFDYILCPLLFEEFFFFSFLFSSDFINLFLFYLYIYINFFFFI